MSVIKINAITVPNDPDSSFDLKQRFEQQAGSVGEIEGFESFELLKPNDDKNTWLVISRWADEQSFQSWLSSSSFAKSHASIAQMPKPEGFSSALWSFETALSSSDSSK